MKPYQRPGVWEENFKGRFNYIPSEGPAQYRRTLYASWRRSIATTFLFDSAQRRAFEVRTSHINKRLQALTLLNDENCLEASRALAALVMVKPVPIREMCLRVLSRQPSKAKFAAHTIIASMLFNLDETLGYLDDYVWDM